TRKLLGDLAEAERKHVTLAENLQHEYVTPEVEAQEEKAHRRLFVLQIVQPGLAGLMDRSVSTLAPVFAAAFATQQPRCICGRSRRQCRSGNFNGVCWSSVGLSGWDLDRKLLVGLCCSRATLTAAAAIGDRGYSLRLEAVTRTREQAAPRQWDHKISQMRRSYGAQLERR